MSVGEGYRAGMKIVLTAPTGHVGSLLAPQIVRAGVRPTLLVRDAEKLDAELRAFADIVELDQGDADAVIAATTDADALYWVDPRTNDDDPLDGYRRMSESVAAAVTANGIPRVVFQSSGGAEARSGFGEIDGLGYTEELLNQTGASVTHLRNGYFFSNLMMDVDSVRNGEIVTMLDLDYRMPWVAPLDIATVAAGRLLSSDWSGISTLGVHGPADLSFNYVAQIVGEAVGRRVVARRLSEAEMTSLFEGFGMTPAQIEAILGMSRGLTESFRPENPRSMATTTPTSLAAWAYENLRPLVNS